MLVYLGLLTTSDSDAGGASRSGADSLTATRIFLYWTAGLAVVSVVLVVLWRWRSSHKAIKKKYASNRGAGVPPPPPSGGGGGGGGVTSPASAPGPDDTDHLLNSGGRRDSHTPPAGSKRDGLFVQVKPQTPPMSGGRGGRTPPRSHTPPTPPLDIKSVAAGDPAPTLHLSDGPASPPTGKSSSGRIGDHFGARASQSHVSGVVSGHVSRSPQETVNVSSARLQFGRTGSRASQIRSPPAGPVTATDKIPVRPLTATKPASDDTSAVPAPPYVPSTSPHHQH